MKFGQFLVSDSLKLKIIRGSLWLSIGGGAEYGLRFLRNMLLARLLAPELLGTMAIILAISAAFESFTQLGIKEAIIQSPRGKEPTYLNIAWWISFGRAIILYAIGFAAAPLIANFYNDQSLVMYIRIAFLIVLFNGSMSVKAYTLLKDMKCVKWAIVNHGGGFLGVLCTIILSIFYHNIWALVIGYVAESALRLILSFCLCPYIPSLEFAKKDTASLIKFSRGVFGLPVFYFVFKKTDIFVLGKLVPKVTLGLYSMVIALAQIPSTFANMLLSPILLPTFSKIINDHNKLKTYLLKLNTMIWVIFLPALAFVGTNGKGLLWQVYGQEYSTQTIVFFFLFSSEVCRILSLPISNLYLALGKPELQRFFVILRAAVMVMLIFPMTKAFGAPGAAASALFSNIVAYFFQFVRAREFTDISLRQYLFAMLKTSTIIVPVIVPTILFAKFHSNVFHGIIPGIIGMIISYSILAIFLLKKGGERSRNKLNSNRMDVECDFKKDSQETKKV